MTVAPELYLALRHLHRAHCLPVHLMPRTADQVGPGAVHDLSRWFLPQRNLPALPYDLPKLLIHHHFSLHCLQDHGRDNICPSQWAVQYSAILLVYFGEEHFRRFPIGHLDI